MLCASTMGTAWDGQTDGHACIMDTDWTQSIGQNLCVYTNISETHCIASQNSVVSIRHAHGLIFRRGTFQGKMHVFN